MNWRPSASLEMLRTRATLLTKIRQFFLERHVLEVETPLLSQHTVTDPFISSFHTFLNTGNHLTKYFLQTSPEYAMKRLLAAGSGSIYQITKAFRQGDVGKKHNPEFTLLEWYRVGFNHHQLMDEMDLFLQVTLGCESAERFSCFDTYKKYVDIDPHEDADELIAKRVRELTSFKENLTHRNQGLELLFTHCIEPHLGSRVPFFLYDFPISQASLAKIREEKPPCASRFEVYFQGLELANGFHELQNPLEQRKRFEEDRLLRKQLALEEVSMDEKFLMSLTHFPACAGVALGIDRLMMLITHKTSLKEVISFNYENA